MPQFAATRRILAILAVAWLLGVRIGAEEPAADVRARSLEYQKKALEAHRKADWPAFLENSRKASELRPGNPYLLYNLACAEARNGLASDAAKILEGLFARRLDFDFEKDEDFAGVRDSAAFAAARRAQSELRKPLGGSTVAFRLPERDLLTEGLAFEPDARAFFVGIGAPEQDPAPRGGRNALRFRRLGARRAARRFSRSPWTRSAGGCTRAAPRSRRWPDTRRAMEGESAVLAFALDGGRLVGRWPMPTDGKKHAAGDLAIAEDGVVYVSDGLGGGIYRFRPDGGPLETVVAPGIFRSPQGLGFGPGGRLYAADWGSGLYRVESGGRREIPGPADLPLFGIDGMVVRGRRIVVTQNGIEPHRVATFLLDEAGDRVVSGAILDMNDPEFAEPTLGALVGDEFFFIGRSQWSLYDEQTGKVDAARLRDPVVLQVRVPRWDRPRGARFSRGSGSPRSRRRPRACAPPRKSRTSFATNATTSPAARPRASRSGPRAGAPRRTRCRARRAPR